MTLSDARRKRDDAKRLLAFGIDPSHQAKLDKISKRASSTNTFDAVADEFLDKAKREGKATVTLAKKAVVDRLGPPGPGPLPDCRD